MAQLILILWILMVLLIWQPHLQVDGVATFTGRDIHSGGITIANAGQIGSVGDL